MTTAPLLELLEHRVSALKKTRPDYVDALELQASFIRADLTSARRPQAEPFALPREQVVARVREGVPLLHDQPAVVDVHFAADLFSRVIDGLVQRDDPDLRTRVTAVIDAATGGRLDPERLFAEAFVQHQDHLVEIAAQGGVDAELLMTVAAQSVAPVLRAYGAHLLPLIERADTGTADGAVWLRGYCPVCGGWPMLGELRGVELAQWLRCAACGSGWRAQRLQCAYCANNDYRTLASLAVEGETRFRISVCERCKGYLKICNAFDPPPPELVVLDDLISVHLDVVAIERGYQRPGGSGFTIELSVPDAEWIEELA